MRWHGGIGGDRSGRMVNNTTRQQRRKESEANPDSSWRLQPLDRELREHSGPGVTVLPFSLAHVQFVCSFYYHFSRDNNTNTNANTNTNIKA